MKKEDLIKLKEHIASLSEDEKKERDIYLRQLALGELQGPPVGYPSIDKPWLKYYKIESIDEKIPSLSMYQFARKMNADNMNNIALELKTSSNNYGPGIKLKYKDFFKRIDITASALKKMGVKEGEIVCTIMPNVPESRILIYAINKIGAIAYPINFMLPSKQLEKILEDNDIKNLFIFDYFCDKFQKVLSSKKLDNIVVSNGLESLPLYLKKILSIKEKVTKKTKNYKFGNNKIIEYDAFYKRGDNQIINPVYNKNNIAIIVGTSGTTGVPKGVCLTNENMNAIAIQQIGSGAYEMKSIYLDILLQSIAYGMTAMHATTCAGFYVELIPEVVSDKIATILSTVKPSPDYFVGGPIHAQNIANSKEYAEGKIDYLKQFISGGASLDKNIEKKLNNVDEDYVENGINNKLFVRNGFGASENGGCGTLATRGAYKFGGIGIPLPLNTYSIFKLNTDEELQYNEEGEICVTGPAIMQYYLNNPEETNKVIKTHSDGTKWVHLADLGYVDKDGQFYHIDRAKNIFMRIGFNIHPFKIKEFITSLPFVSECEVIGFKHPNEQTVPVVFIKFDEFVKENDYMRLIDEINNECYENLDEVFMPYKYCIVNEMPLNISGKIMDDVLIDNSKIDFYNNDSKETLVLKIKNK